MHNILPQAGLQIQHGKRLRSHVVNPRVCQIRNFLVQSQHHYATLVMVRDHGNTGSSCKLSSLAVGVVALASVTLTRTDVFMHWTGCLSSCTSCHYTQCHNEAYPRPTKVLGVAPDG